MATELQYPTGYRMSAGVGFWVTRGPEFTQLFQYPFKSQIMEYLN